MAKITVTNADGATLEIEDTPRQKAWAEGKGYTDAVEVKKEDATPPKEGAGGD